MRSRWSNLELAKAFGLSAVVGALVARLAPWITIEVWGAQNLPPRWVVAGGIFLGLLGVFAMVCGGAMALLFWVIRDE